MNEPRAAMTAPVIEDFLIARGGPFWELQRRLGLLHESALHAGRRALLFVGLAWFVPLLLSAAEGQAVGAWTERPFLLGLGVAARFLVAVALFVLMERAVEERLRVLLRQFVAAPLVAPTALPAAAVAVNQALRRRDDPVAEVVILILAVGLGLLGARHAALTDPAPWLASAEGTLTLAAWWVALVSAPIFWFLLLRWLYRHFVWAALLRGLGRLDLRLVATHPDGTAGLGFIAQYPNAFASLVFGMSCVIGAALAQGLLHGKVDPSAFKYVVGIWLVIVLALFSFPLLAFSRPLRRLKQDTTLAYAALATRHDRAAERSMLGRNLAAAGDADETGKGDVPDPTKTYATVQKLSTWPVKRTALLPIGLAAIGPLLAAGATLLPVKELLGFAKLLLL
jgi:hypothetical protein